jgi:hypothetical protein
MAFFAVDDIRADQRYGRLNHVFREATTFRKSNYLKDVLLRFGGLNKKVGSTFGGPRVDRSLQNRSFQKPIKRDGALRSVNRLFEHGRVPRHLGEQSKPHAGGDIGKWLREPVLSPEGGWFVAEELKGLLRGDIGGSLSHFQLILHNADVSGLREAAPALGRTIRRRSRC